MALNFPASPAVGALYPQPALAGVPVYRWDGEKWTTQGATPTKTPVYTDGSTPMTAQLGLVTPPANDNHAASKKYVDDSMTTKAVRYDAAQALTTPQMLQARQNIAAAPLDAIAFNGFLLNSGFALSQERVAGTGVNSGYVCDGWALGQVGAMAVTAFLSPAPYAGFPNALVITVGTPTSSFAAGDYVQVFQPLEGLRISRLAFGNAIASPITVAFWTQHHRPGIYSFAVTNGAGTRSYVTTYNQNVADALEYKVITIPGDTAGAWVSDSTRGLYVVFTMAAGTTYATSTLNQWLAGTFYGATSQVNGVAAASDVFRVTGVTMFPGVDAPLAAYSPLIVRPTDQELNLAMRHWQKSYGDSVYAGATSQEGVRSAACISVSNRAFIRDGHLQVAMRIVPTLTFYSAPGSINSIAGYSSGNRYDVSSVAGQSARTVGSYIQTVQSASPATEELLFHFTANARM